MPGAKASHVSQIGEPMATDVPEGNHEREDQPAVEHATRPEQRQRILPEMVEIDHHQQQLRTDEGAEDNGDAEIHDAVAVEAACAGAHDRELQTDQIRAGQQDAVREYGEGALDQTGVETCRFRNPMSRMSSAAPIVMAESATVERPEVPARPVDVDKVDDISGRHAIDHIPYGSADHERQTELCQRFARGRAYREDADGDSVRPRQWRSSVRA